MRAVRVLVECTVLGSRETSDRCTSLTSASPYIVVAHDKRAAADDDWTDSSCTPACWVVSVCRPGRARPAGAQTKQFALNGFNGTFDAPPWQCGAGRGGFASRVFVGWTVAVTSRRLRQPVGICADFCLSLSLSLSLSVCVCDMAADLRGH